MPVEPINLNDQFVSDYQKIEFENRDLQAELRRLRETSLTELPATREELAKLTGERDTLLAERETLQSEREKINSELKACRRDAESQQRQHDQLQGEIERLNKQIADQKKQMNDVADRNAACRGLQGENDKLKVDLAVTSRQLATVKEKLASTIQELEEARKASDAAAARFWLKQCEEEKKQLAERVMELESQIFGGDGKV
jgi:ribonuclease Y